MKTKLIAASLLLSLMAWAIPIHAASAIYAQRSSQTISEIHDQAGASTTQADNSERQEESQTKEQVIKDNAIQPPLPQIQPIRKSPVHTNQVSGRHSTRAEKQISAGKLADYLSQKGSPLALYSEELLASPYWSTIIGICTIEQYGCTRAPSWNFWGIKGTGGCGKSGKGFAQYCTAEEGITAISNLLTRYESKGKDTLEELNGYYVQPASQNWFNTVLKTKTKLESL